MKAAIELHAVSYVEKPINIKELSDAITNAHYWVERARRDEKHLLQSLIISQQTKTDLSIEASTMREKIIMENTTFQVGVLKLSDVYYNLPRLKSFVEKRIIGFTDSIETRCHLFHLDYTNIVIIFMGNSSIQFNHSHQRENFWTELSDVLGNIKWFLALGSTAHNSADLSLSYKIANEALKSLSYQGWNKIAYHDSYSNVYSGEFTENYLQLIKESILKKDEDRTIQILVELKNNLLENKYFMNFNIRNFYHNIQSVIDECWKELNVFGSKQLKTTNENYAFDQYETFLEVHDFVVRHVRLLFQDVAVTGDYDFIVKTILSYLQENYADTNLTISTVADNFFLSPSYVSSRFKQKTGVTLGQYLTELRLGKAMLLLQDPSLKLYHISLMVGYEDSNYFARLFKKHMGCTPTEYRECI